MQGKVLDVALEIRNVLLVEPRQRAGPRLEHRNRGLLRVLRGIGEQVPAGRGLFRHLRRDVLDLEPLGALGGVVEPLPHPRGHEVVEQHPMTAGNPPRHGHAGVGVAQELGHHRLDLGLLLGQLAEVGPRVRRILLRSLLPAGRVPGRGGRGGLAGPRDPTSQRLRVHRLALARLALPGLLLQLLVHLHQAPLGLGQLARLGEGLLGHLLELVHLFPGPLEPGLGQLRGLLLALDPGVEGPQEPRRRLRPDVGLDGLPLVADLEAGPHAPEVQAGGGLLGHLGPGEVHVRLERDPEVEGADAQAEDPGVLPLAHEPLVVLVGDLVEGLLELLPGRLPGRHHLFPEGLAVQGLLAHLDGLHPALGEGAGQDLLEPPVLLEAPLEGGHPLLPPGPEIPAGPGDPALIGGPEHPELLHLLVQLHPFEHQGVAGKGGLHLGERELVLAVGLVEAAPLDLADQHLVDEPLLLDQPVVTHGIQGLGDAVVVDLHLGVPVLLPHDPAVSLLDVHGPVGHVHVVGGDEPVLHVHADPQLLGAPDHHPALAVPHPLEQGLALGVGAGLLHHADLGGRHAQGHQLLLDLLVGVEPPARAPAEVQEHGLSGALGLGPLPDLVHPLHHLVELAPRVILVGRIHQAEVHRGLPGRRVKHQGDVPLLHLLPAGEALPRLPGPADGVDVLGELLVGLDPHLLGPAALHVRELEVGLVRQEHVRHGVKEGQELRAVHVLVEPLHVPPHARLGLLEGDRGLPEGGREVVEELHPVLLEEVGAEVAHHGPELGRGVRDGRPGGEHHVFAPGLRAHVVGLEHQGGGALARARVDPLDPGHLGEELAPLVRVRLVDQEGVHAHLLPGEGVVHPAVQEPGELLALSLLERLELLHPGGLLPLLALGLAHRLGDHVELLLDERGLPLRVVRDPVEEALGEHHRVPVARGDLAEEPLAVPGAPLVVVGDQHLGLGEGLGKGLAVLGDRGVVHHDQGLLGRGEPAHLHGQVHVDEGLARAHTVGQQGRLLEAPHDGLLGGLPELEVRVGPREVVHVRDLELPQPVPVVGLVVAVRELLAPGLVGPGPALEPGLDLGLLALGRDGGVLVDLPALVPVLVPPVVVDLAPLEVEGVLEELVAGFPGNAPGLHVQGVPGAAVGLHRPAHGLPGPDLAHPGGHAELLLEEVLDGRLGHPGRAQPEGDELQVQGLGLDRLEGLHVGPVPLVLLGRGLGLAELLADVPGKVEVRGLHPPVFRVDVGLPVLQELPLQRLPVAPQDPGHVLRVQAAPVDPADLDGVLERLGRLRLLPGPEGAPGEDRGLLVLLGVDQALPALAGPALDLHLLGHHGLDLQGVHDGKLAVELTQEGVGRIPEPLVLLYEPVVGRVQGRP